jgi:hypothetical protein
MPEPSPTPWRDQLPDWPLAAREAWGFLANSLTESGLSNWVEAERRAANEVYRRMKRGEFAADPAPVPPAIAPARTGRRAPAAGARSFGFGEGR